MSCVSGDERMTPMSELREELQEKKDRVKKRLMETDSDDNILYKENKKVNIFFLQYMI